MTESKFIKRGDAGTGAQAPDDAGVLRDKIQKKLENQDEKELVMILRFIFSLEELK